MFNTLNILLLSLLFICFVVQMMYWWQQLALPYFKQKKGDKQRRSDLPPVSVIVYIGHSSDDMERNITALLNQEYPNFEVIAINDHLPEESVDILKRMEYEHKHFYFTNIPNSTRNLSRKKLGLMMGIKAAKYDRLLFTESDSRPVSRHWITSMAQRFRQGKSVVLGFSVLNKQDGVKKKFAAYDYFFTNLQIISRAMKGRAYGANGRNMGYEKRHFVEKKGFSSYRFLQSGADDLFVNGIAEKHNLSANVFPSGLVRTYWNDSDAWYRWKSERAFTTRYYSKSSRLFWQAETLSRSLFYFLFLYLVAAYFLTIYIPAIALGMYLMRLASQLVIINKTAAKLKSAKYYALLPLFDVWQLFTNFRYFLKGIFKNKEGYTWNLGQ